MKNPRPRVSEAWKPGRREEKKLLLWILLEVLRCNPKVLLARWAPKAPSKQLSITNQTWRGPQRSIKSNYSTREETKTLTIKNTERLKKTQTVFLLAQGCLRQLKEVTGFILE